MRTLTLKGIPSKTTGLKYHMKMKVMSPEKGPFWKESSLPNNIFQGFLHFVFGGKYWESANLNHLFSSCSSKPNKIWVSLKLVANWDGFSMKILTESHLQDFIPTPEQRILSIKDFLQLHPADSIFLFEGVKVWSGFQSGWRNEWVIWWYAPDLSAMFLRSRTFRSWSTWLVHK